MTKMLRMLRNSRTLKIKNGWQRNSGARFTMEDIKSAQVGPNNTITINHSGWLKTTVKTRDLNLRETEELIGFIEVDQVKRMHDLLTEPQKALLRTHIGTGVTP